MTSTLERKVLELSQRTGIGAQFGGKYFCHDVRIIRLPRHGASCPVAMAVSCSADRQALGKITRDGVFLEQLERDPARFLPDVTDEHLDDSDVVRIDLNRPMAEILAELSAHPVRTRVMLTGPMVVARDIAHAKIKERLDAGEPMPQYLRDHCVYYAGPAKTPEGYASGSFGPTTAGRMDSYVDQFQAAGGSMVMLAKGNRSKQVTAACKEHGGFYLGSIGGPAARLALDNIRKVEVLEYPELGMEAVWKIDVVDFPAFIVVDDKGNDFFEQVRARGPVARPRRHHLTPSRTGRPRSDRRVASLTAAAWLRQSTLTPGPDDRLDLLLDGRPDEVGLADAQRRDAVHGRPHRRRDGEHVRPASLRNVGEHGVDEVVERLEGLRPGEGVATEQRMRLGDLAGLQHRSQVGVIEFLALERRAHEHQPVVLGVLEPELRRSSARPRRVRRAATWPKPTAAAMPSVSWTNTSAQTAPSIASLSSK